MIIQGQQDYIEGQIDHNKQSRNFDQIYLIIQNSLEENSKDYISLNKIKMKPLLFRYVRIKTQKVLFQLSEKEYEGFNLLKQDLQFQL